MLLSLAKNNTMGCQRQKKNIENKISGGKENHTRERESQKESFLDSNFCKSNLMVVFFSHGLAFLIDTFHFVYFFFIVITLYVVSYVHLAHILPFIFHAQIKLFRTQHVAYACAMHVHTHIVHIHFRKQIGILIAKYVFCG